MTPSARILPKAFRSLERFARAKEERCELCAAPVSHRHQHLLEPKSRTVLCACDGCALLFDDSGRTKYKRIPRDPRHLPGLQLTEETWARLLVPVKLAFFYRSSHAGKPVAIYPSPMGATESVIDPEPWAALAAAHPGIAGLNEDVEALLVSRIAKAPPNYLIAPIDRCFALVGILRRHWQGINGGDEVWPEVTRYLTELRERAV
jgi:hypothetical protein